QQENNAEEIHHPANQDNEHAETDIQTADSPQRVVNRVSVKLPPFWPEDVELWFAQVEAQFTIAHVT
ncbi:hypothetical protein J6590_037164, partial [Homalodisca vitripennis]